jgi:hypothetical protein
MDQRAAPPSLEVQAWLKEKLTIGVCGEISFEERASPGTTPYSGEIPDHTHSYPLIPWNIPCSYPDNI